MQYEPKIQENAEDSLQHAIAHYLVRHEHPTAIKHAVLTLFHSIELFLKERLARVNPLLVLKNLDEPARPDPPTVSVVNAMTRLANLGVRLPKEQLAILDDLRKRRNAIEHYEFDPALDHEPLVGKGLKFLIAFLPEHLGFELKELVDREETYKQLLEAVLTYDERVAQAIKEAEATHKVVVRCPECGIDALCPDPALHDYCFFCHETVPVEACERCGEYVAASEIGPSYLCRNCEDHALHAF